MALDKESISKKRVFRKRNIVLAIFLVLVILLLVFIPRYYSNRIIQPIIVKSFSELTKEKYVLKMDHLNWSLLNNTIQIGDIHILPKVQNDSLEEKPFINAAILDEIKIEGLHYSSLFDGKIEFDFVKFNRISIDVTSQQHQDTVSENEISSSLFKGFFKSIVVETLDLNQIDFCFEYKRDSLITIHNANIYVHDLYLDSTNYSIQNEVDVFNKLKVFIEDIKYRDAKSIIGLSELDINMEKRIHEINLALGEFTIENLETKNYSGIQQTQLKYEYSPSDSLDGRKNKLTITMAALENKVLVQQKFDVKKLINTVEEELSQLSKDFSLDTLSIAIDSIKHIGNDKTILVNRMDYTFAGIVFQDSMFNYQNYSIQTKQLSLYTNSATDSLSFSSFSYDEQEETLILNDLYYQEDTTSKLSVKRLSLSDFDMVESLIDKDLNIGSLKIDKPEFYLYYQGKKKSHLPWSIQIKDLIIDSLNTDLIPLGIHLENAHILSDRIAYRYNVAIEWYDLFHEIDLSFDYFTYQKPYKQSYFEFGPTHFNTYHQYFNNSYFIVNWDDNKTGSEAQFLGNHIFVNGFNWKEIIANSSRIKMDSIEFSDFSINAKINKKQTNKNIDSIWYFHSNYIHVNDIETHIRMNRQNDSSLLDLDQTNIYANHFTFDLSKPEIVSYENLNIHSLKSSYQQSLNSFYVQAEEWNTNANQQVFTASDFKLQFQINDSISQKQSEFKLRIPTVYFSGIHPIEYIKNRDYHLDSVNIASPQLEVKSKNGIKNKLEGDTKNLFQQFREQVGKIGNISIGDFIVSNMKLRMESKYLHSLNELNIDRIDLSVERFYLDYIEVEKMNKFLFSDAFTLKLEHYSQNINNGKHLIYLNKAEVSSINNQLFFQDFRFMTLDHMNALPINIYAQEIKLENFALIPHYNKPELSIGTILVKNSNLNIRERRNALTKPIDLTNINLFPLISKELSAVSVQQIDLKDLDIEVLGIEFLGHKKLDLQGVNLGVENLLLDSNNRVFTDKKFFYCDDIQLDLPSFSMISKSHLYQFAFNKMRISSKEKKLVIHSLSIKPRYDRKTFSENISSQKDMLDFDFPSLIIDKIDFRDIIFRKRFTAQKLIISEPQLNIYKDKTIAFDTNVYKAMPAKMLKDLPFYLRLDTVEVINANLQYEELSKNMPTPGLISFDKMNVFITGISNDADFREFGGALKIKAHARIMNQSLVNLSLMFPLKSEEQEFVMIASLNSLPIKELNPIMRPLALVSAKEGDIIHMQMNARGNNDRGYGDMILKYKNLKIEVFKKSLKESQLESFLVNSIFIKKNNKSYFGARKGPIYFERNKHRSAINYVVHLALYGAKTSIGIERKKTAKKIKALYEETK